ncbi:MAG: LacI family transcriptional regulator [Planctomycetota bacterium]|nr:LacI family transcriptional regulator [Planctomycetota bacterium]
MPSIKDVAKLAGVSPMTASRVINESGQVSMKMKLRVMRAVKQLGYRPNFNARSLRVQKSRLFGLILPDIENPLFASLAKHVEVAANNHGYNVMVGTTWEDRHKEREYLELMISRQIEGMIISPSSEENVDAFLNCPIPVALLDRKLPGASHIPSLTVDNMEIGRLAARHLLSLGHRHFACIAGPQSIELFTERANGFRQELAAAGRAVEACVTAKDMNELSKIELGPRYLYEIMERCSAMPVGLFCANDLAALGAMQAAHKLKLAVPGQLSIVGVDDIPACKLTTPTLTSIAQPMARIASEGVKLLIDRLHDSECRPGNVVLQPELIVRESTARTTNASRKIHL